MNCIKVLGRKSWGRHGWNGVRVAIAVLPLLFSSASPSAAAPHEEQKVRKAVENWVRHTTADHRAKALVARSEPYKRNGVTVAYIIHLDGGGYCLAGADSRLLPVYWY